MSLFGSLLAATGLAALVMLAVWLTALRIGNAGIVDIAWSFNFAALAWLFAVVSPGYMPRRIVVAVIVTFWSFRLGGYLYARVMGHHPVEDGRYQQLRLDWAPHANRAFFGFFELQALLNVILSLPFLLASRNPDPSFSALEGAAVGLWAIALLGEATADRQLDRFRKDPANRGRTCRVGLWRYSRHPNYFFEWLVWVAYFLLALGAPGGSVAVYCPLLMLYFLFRVTGIPMTEAQALKSRGDEYRDYQRTTSAFVPWFPRTSP
jgi:steroid 5-alpha reductase family enzyme